MKLNARQKAEIEAAFQMWDEMMAHVDAMTDEVEGSGDLGTAVLDFMVNRRYKLSMSRFVEWMGWK